MTKRTFTSRPGDVERWIKTTDVPPHPSGEFTARLTIDISPALRGRIKVTAFQRDQTMADMLRDLLDREFPDNTGDTP